MVTKNKKDHPKEKVFFTLQWTEKTRIPITPPRMRFLIGCLIVVWVIILGSTRILDLFQHIVNTMYGSSAAPFASPTLMILIALPVIVLCIIYTIIGFKKTDTELYKVARVFGVGIGAFFLTYFIIFLLALITHPF